WQAVTGRQRSTVWYICFIHKARSALVPDECRLMSSVSRSASVRRDATVRHSKAVTLYRPGGPAGKKTSKLRRVSETALTTTGLDLSTRLRIFQRTLRSRVEHRGALLEIIRALNITLDPARLAEIIVERAATWIPAPCWAIVSPDLSGQLSVLA